MGSKSDNYNTNKHIPELGNMLILYLEIKNVEGSSIKRDVLQNKTVRKGLSNEILFEQHKEDLRDHMAL